MIGSSRRITPLNFRKPKWLLAASFLMTVAATACGTSNAEIRQASDQFDLNTVSAQAIYEASKEAMTEVMSYRFSGGYVLDSGRVSIDGEWSSEGLTRYVIGDETGFSSTSVGNGEVVLSNSELFLRDSGSIRWTNSPVRTAINHPPFGNTTPVLENLEFVDRGAPPSDQVIWIRGSLVADTPVLLPAGNRTDPQLSAAAGGTLTLVINKFDLFIDTVIAKVEAQVIDLANSNAALNLTDITPITSTYSFREFNEPVDITLPAAER